MFHGDALSSWLLLFVGSGAACALAAVYRLMWRHRYRPLDAMGRRTFRIVGRIVSPPDRDDCFEIEVDERRHLVMADGALIDVRPRWRAGRTRLELREGDLVTIDGTLGQRRRRETLYRQPGSESVVEAVRVIGGAWPELRWLVTPVIAVMALLAAVSLTQLLGLGHAPRSGDEASVSMLVGDPLYSYHDDDGSWVVLPPGRMLVGPIADRCAADAEKLRYVHIKHTFEIGRTEVTRRQFERLMGYDPSRGATCGGRCPAENLSWHEAAAYANALSYRRGLAPCYVCRGAGRDVRCMAAPVDSDSSAATSASAGDDAVGNPIYRCGGYRLPTEDEWEYAARAGSRDALPSGPLPNCSSASWRLSEVAWFRGNAAKRTHAVARRRPNRWRLFDVAGNVAEWTHDRVTRGGGFASTAKDVRFSARSERPGTFCSPQVGLRVVRSL